MLQGFFQGATWIVVLVIVAAVLVVGFIVFKIGHRVVEANEALVVTGGKKGMQIYTSGGAYVSFLRKSAKFSLGNMTVRSDDQETQTSTKVMIVVKWTAQLRPDTTTEGALEKAIRGFIGYRGEDDIKESLKHTLDGEIRQVVATLTPDEVITSKEEFSTQVTTNVAKKMTDLGFELVSLNIAEVSDNNGYYENLSAEDRESKRRNAETLTAQANKEIAVAQAEADQVAETATLQKQMVVAEKGREVALRQAEIDQETANATGKVTVVRAQQEKEAALAQREVAITQADTERQTIEIQAQSAARQSEIEAEAAATVAKAEAAAAAETATIKAKGESDAITLRTNADAEQVRQRGQAEADAARAKGEADAAAILAIGTAEAERERLMAEALAANEGANLTIRLAEIESEMRIKISTETATAMGSIGEKVTIIDMGGNSSGEGGVLTDFLGQLPAALQKADLTSTLINGVPLGAALSSLIGGFRGGPQATKLPVGLHSDSEKPADKPEAPAPVVAATSVEVPAQETKAPVKVTQVTVDPDAASGRFGADDAVEALQAAAEAAPDILAGAQQIGDAVRPGKRQRS